MKAFVLAYDVDGPPSIAYDAIVNGAPPKPMSGTRPSSSCRSIRIVVNTWPSASRGSNVRMRSTSDTWRIGRSIEGPSPFRKSKSSPIGVKGSSRSEKRIAASTSITSTGCSVTATASSGSRQIWSNE
jgi:hypothetical protein